MTIYSAYNIHYSSKLRHDSRTIFAENCWWWSILTNPASGV